MAAGVPLLKLGLLLVRTAAKPLASELKRRAAVTEGSLLQRACIGVGQLTHTSSKSAQLWLAGHRRVKVKPLDDPKALSAGADVMGETLIYTVAAGTIIFEVTRSQHASHVKEAEKRAAAAAERAALDARLTALEAAMRRVEAAAAGGGGAADDDGLLTALARRARAAAAFVRGNGGADAGRRQ